MARALAVVLLLLPAAARASGRQPSAPGWLQFGRPRALLELRAERDDGRQHVATTDLNRREQFFMERARIDLDGTLYDERFADFSIGGGGALSQTDLRGYGERYSRSTDHEYQGRLNLLPKHPLSGALFAEQGQATIHNVFAGRTRLDRSNWRGGLTLRSGPLPMSVSYYNSRVGGGGFGVPFEQKTEGASWVATTRPDGPFSASLRQSLERFRDANGPGFDHASSSMLLELKPGETQRLSSISRLENRKGSLSLRILGSDLDWDGRWGRLQTGARYGFEEKRTQGQLTQRQNAQLRGERRFYDSLTLSALADAEWNRETASRSEARKGQAQGDYVRRLWGPFRLTAQHRRSLREARSEYLSLLDTVIDEGVLLRDGSPAFLAHPNVTVETLSVISADRLRRYREGIDYETIPRGTLLEMRRLVTGSIVDGETVLVSYSHTTSGRRKTRDDAHGTRVALQLGGQGSLFWSEDAQRQTLVEASQQSLAPELESYRERGWGADLNWKYFAMSQIWRRRDSNMSPLEGFRSHARLGGAIGRGVSAVTTWNYESTRFLLVGDRSLGRNYSVELGWIPLTRLDLRGEWRAGSANSGGVPARFQAADFQLRWSHRSVDVEFGDRFTRRWIADSFSEDNFVSLRILRHF